MQRHGAGQRLTGRVTCRAHTGPAPALLLFSPQLSLVCFFLSFLECPTFSCKRLPPFLLKGQTSKVFIKEIQCCDVDGMPKSEHQYRASNPETCVRVQHGSTVTEKRGEVVPSCPPSQSSKAFWPLTSSLPQSPGSLCPQLH